MTDVSEADVPPQTNGFGDDGVEEDDRTKMRPADIDADMREMERRKRVEMIMSSRLFREELERIIEIQMKDGNGPAGLLQQISDMMGIQGGRLQSTNFFKSSNCVVPINDIRGVESMGYAKGEKILRCKLAAVYRLMDLYGWTQNIYNHITARLNQDQEHFLVNPFGMLYHEITASSLVKVDMQGQVVEQGTTNFGINIAGFQLHAAVHAARPDIKCIIHLHTPSVLAVSSLKCGLLPLSQESIVIGEVSQHPYLGSINEPEEKEKLARDLGPINKVMFLTNHGAVCCGETIEEAFYNVYNTVLACETQLKLMPVGIENLQLIPDETRKQIYDAARNAPEGTAPPPSQIDKKEKRFRIGGLEYEALMRMLDNAGFRTGYIYRQPLVKGDPPRPRNDVEVPPAVSSLGYLLEEEEMYKHGNWKKYADGRKSNDRTRWLNSPNVYQKVEILETGTPDPKKITKWVEANAEEWVADGSPQHSSTPVKIESALQFVPKNTNPKEFKKLQQLIKENRRADKITSGPQSHILEGVSWEEAKKLQDANISQTGDQVILVGAASKGIIQRGFQHNATVYKTPYAKNPFDAVSDQELEDYKRVVTRKQKGESSYEEDQSESEALSSSAALPPTGVKSPASETEEESRDEPRVLRIETKQVPRPSQAEVVLSDEGDSLETDLLPAQMQRSKSSRYPDKDPINVLNRSNSLGRNQQMNKDACGNGNGPPSQEDDWSSHVAPYYPTPCQSYPQVVKVSTNYLNAPAPCEIISLSPSNIGTVDKDKRFGFVKKNVCDILNNELKHEQFSYTSLQSTNANIKMSLLHKELKKKFSHTKKAKKNVSEDQILLLQKLRHDNLYNSTNDNENFKTNEYHNIQLEQSNVQCVKSSLHTFIDGYDEEVAPNIGHPILHSHLSDLNENISNGKDLTKTGATHSDNVSFKSSYLKEELDSYQPLTNDNYEDKYESNLKCSVSNNNVPLNSFHKTHNTISYENVEESNVCSTFFYERKSPDVIYISGSEGEEEDHNSPSVVQTNSPQCNKEKSFTEIDCKYFSEVCNQKLDLLNTVSGTVCSKQENNTAYLNPNICIETNATTDNTLKNDPQSLYKGIEFNDQFSAEDNFNSMFEEECCIERDANNWKININRCTFGSGSEMFSNYESLNNEDFYCHEKIPTTLVPSIEINKSSCESNGNYNQSCSQNLKDIPSHKTCNIEETLVSENIYIDVKEHSSLLNNEVMGMTDEVNLNCEVSRYNVDSSPEPETENMMHSVIDTLKMNNSNEISSQYVTLNLDGSQQTLFNEGSNLCCNSEYINGLIFGRTQSPEMKDGSVPCMNSSYISCKEEGGTKNSTLEEIPTYKKTTVESSDLSEAAEKDVDISSCDQGDIQPCDELPHGLTSNQAYWNHESNLVSCYMINLILDDISALRESKHSPNECSFCVDETNDQDCNTIQNGIYNCITYLKEDNVISDNTTVNYISSTVTPSSITASLNNRFKVQEEIKNETLREILPHNKLTIEGSDFLETPEIHKCAENYSSSSDKCCENGVDFCTSCDRDRIQLCDEFPLSHTHNKAHWNCESNSVSCYVINLILDNIVTLSTLHSPSEFSMCVDELSVQECSAIQNGIYNHLTYFKDDEASEKIIATCISSNATSSSINSDFSFNVRSKEKAAIINETLEEILPHNKPTVEGSDFSEDPAICKFAEKCLSLSYKCYEKCVDCTSFGQDYIEPCDKLPLCSTNNRSSESNSVSCYVINLILDNIITLSESKHSPTECSFCVGEINDQESVMIQKTTDNFKNENLSNLDLQSRVYNLKKYWKDDVPINESQSTSEVLNKVSISVKIPKLPENNSNKIENSHRFGEPSSVYNNGSKQLFVPKDNENIPFNCTKISNVGTSSILTSDESDGLEIKHEFKFVNDSWTIDKASVNLPIQETAILTSSCGTDVEDCISTGSSNSFNTISIESLPKQSKHVSNFNSQDIIMDDNTSVSDELDSDCEDSSQESINTENNCSNECPTLNFYIGAEFEDGYDYSAISVVDIDRDPYYKEAGMVLTPSSSSSPEPDSLDYNVVQPINKPTYCPPNFYEEDLDSEAKIKSTFECKIGENYFKKDYSQSDRFNIDEKIPTFIVYDINKPTKFNKLEKMSKNIASDCTSNSSICVKATTSSNIDECVQNEISDIILYKTLEETISTDFFSLSDPSLDSHIKLKILKPDDTITSASLVEFSSIYLREFESIPHSSPVEKRLSWNKHNSLQNYGENKNEKFEHLMRNLFSEGGNSGTSMETNEYFYNNCTSLSFNSDAFEDFSFPTSSNSECQLVSKTNSTSGNNHDADFEDFCLAESFIGSRLSWIESDIVKTNASSTSELSEIKFVKNDPEEVEKNITFEYEEQASMQQSYLSKDTVDTDKDSIHELSYISGVSVDDEISDLTCNTTNNSDFCAHALSSEMTETDVMLPGGMQTGAGAHYKSCCQYSPLALKKHTTLSPIPESY